MITKEQVTLFAPLLDDYRPCVFLFLTIVYPCAHKSSPSNYFYLYFFREKKHPSKIESSKKSFILQRHTKESYFYYNFNLIYIYFHIVKYFYFLYKKISLFSHKKSLSFFFLFDKLPNYVLLNVYLYEAHS